MASASQVDIQADIPAIVDACMRHLEAHWQDRGYRDNVVIGTKYFVKFGDGDTLYSEYATQSYISEYAETHPDTTRDLRVPKAIHFFRVEKTAYLVMEYIKLEASPSDLSERIVGALRWLSGVPAPPGHVIGPLGSGYIRHGFFKDNEAPLRFSSVEALERYIEKVRLSSHFRKRPHPLRYTLDQARRMLSNAATKPVQPVSICGDRLMFTQSDVDTRNFGVDEHGNTVLLGFEQIAVVPESFAVFAMSLGGLTGVCDSLGWSSNSTFSMAVISSILWMTGNPTLGVSSCT